MLDDNYMCFDNQNNQNYEDDEDYDSNNENDGFQRMTKINYLDDTQSIDDESSYQPSQGSHVHRFG